MSVRFTKVRRDLTERWGRTTLTVLGLVLGLIFVGMVVTAFAILRDDLEANFQNTNPPNITALVDGLSDAQLQHIRALDGVQAATSRQEFVSRLEIAPGQWMAAEIIVVPDFTATDIARISPESGAWPPPDGAFLIERDGRWFFRDLPQGSMAIVLPDGSVVHGDYAGYAFDAAQHQSRAEQMLYLYLSPATLASWRYQPDKTVLMVRTKPMDAVRVAGALEEMLRQDGIRVSRFEAQQTVKHGHQFQVDAVLSILGGVAALALMICAMLAVNLIDSLMAKQQRAKQQRAIGVLRAIGGSGGQITLDYVVGVGSLGAVAGIVSLYPALWLGRQIARGIAMGQNFNLLSPQGPIWLIPSMLAISVILPVLITLHRIWRTANLPVRLALSRADQTQAAPLSDTLAPLFSPLPILARVAGRSLLRKPQQALITALILSVGLAGFITTLTMRASMLSTVEEVARTKPFDLGVALRTSEPIGVLRDWLKQFPEITDAEFLSRANASLLVSGASLSISASLVGVPDDSKALRPEILQGHWLHQDQSEEIVVNQMMMAANPGLRLNEPVRMTVGDKVASVVIVGVIKEFGPAMIYTSSTLVEHMTGTAQSSNSLILTLAESSIKAQRLAAAAIETKARQDNRQIAGILQTRELEAVIRGHLDPISIVLGGLAAVALLVGALGLASSISVNIVERYREIGVLKAIGGSGRAISKLFMTEALFIGLLSWVIAVAAAPLLSRPVTRVFGESIIKYPFDYHSDPASLAIALAVSAIVSVLASAVPVRLAIRKSIYGALRTE